MLLDAPGGEPDVIVIATGSEVEVALDAAVELGSREVAVRVVAMPSWELFEAQDAEYREAVLPGRPERVPLCRRQGCTA